MSIKISAVIITHNEAENIQLCLSSLTDVADEIIVVDSFSTDNTVEIAQKYGAIVFKRAFKGFSNQKNWGNGKASHSWILSMDADEQLSEQLKESILDFKKSNPTYKAYTLNRINNFCGTWIKYAGWYPDTKLRLWNKEYGRWNDNQVHEDVRLDKGIETGRLKGDLLHYSFRTLGQHYKTILKYSSLRVKSKIEKGKKFTLPLLLFQMMYKFFIMYFIKCGFLHGKNGFILCFNSSLKYIIQFALANKATYNTKENVCFVNTTKMWGGGEKWHSEAALFIHKQKKDVFFIARKKSKLATKLESTGLKLNTIKSSNRSFLNPFKIAKLYWFYRNNNIKSVLLNGPADLKLAGMAAFLAGVPNIIYRRGIATPPKGSLHNNFLFTIVATEFIVNSNNTLEELLKKVDIKKCHISHKLLYNGIETEKFKPVEKQKHSNKVILGNASRLVHQKGIDLLIESAQHLKSSGIDFVLKIAGTGPLRENLQKQVDELGLTDTIEFCGFIEDIPAFINTIDIYVCGSRFEGFGFSMAEAMLLEKPVIAYNTSSNPEIVTHNQTGYLAEAFDTKEFALKTAELIQSPAKAKQFGKAGREDALKRFDLHTQHMELHKHLFTNTSTSN